MSALMREMSCHQELLPSFPDTGNELFVLKEFPRLRRKRVFRKWLWDEKLLTQTPRAKQPLSCHSPHRVQFLIVLLQQLHQRVACMGGVNPLSFPYAYMSTALPFPQDNALQNGG